MQFGVLTYVPGDSPVHRCDARLKVLALLAFSIGLFFVGSWWLMALCALVVFAMLVLSRVPLGVVNRMLVPVYVLAAFSMLCNVLANPTIAGTLAGLVFGLRMIVLVAASFIVCLTTTSSELLRVFRWLIGPLAALHVPVDDIALTLALSLRFIPVIEREFDTVRAAQKSRGAELSGSLAHKLAMWGAAFSAVFIGLFRHANNLALAMDARCYGVGEAKEE